MKVAINGAGIAGPTLAYWLADAGHRVLLIEEASALRTLEAPTSTSWM